MIFVVTSLTRVLELFTADVLRDDLHAAGVYGVGAVYVDVCGRNTPTQHHSRVILLRETQLLRLLCPWLG